jgi:hypothetical protein
MAKAKTKKTTPVVKKEVVDKQNLSKDLKKASKTAAKVVSIDFTAPEEVAEVSNIEVASEVVVETVTETVVEAVVETPSVVREKSVAEVQQEYVDKLKNQIAEANKAKADWLVRITEERKVAEEMKALEVEASKETIPEAPAEVAQEMNTQEAILDRYLKTRGSHTDINHYELANTGFDIHALDSNLNCVVGRFTLIRPYVGGYWNVTEKK